MEKNNILRYNKVMEEFKKLPFEKRKAESTRIRSKYPTQRCLIVERAKSSTTIPEANKLKYLVPMDITVGQFISVLRKRIKLTETQAIFLFIDGDILPPTAATIDNLYEQYHNEDGFLYMTYAAENTFG